MLAVEPSDSVKRIWYSPKELPIATVIANSVPPSVFTPPLSRTISTIVPPAPVGWMSSTKPNSAFRTVSRASVPPG